MNSKYLPSNSRKISNPDKAYELKVYRFISYAVATIDILNAIIGFIFWRGV